MSHRTISTILRHDSKQTSYKIALLRSLNDVVLAYPDVGRDGRDVAVPLRALAEAWVAYFWPFVAPGTPVLQGVRSLLGGELRQDVGFRAHLTELRRDWEAIYGPSGAAGGWHLIEHLRVARKRAGYPAVLVKRYRDTLTRIATALRQPIRYAGPGEWAVFAPPRPLREVAGAPPLPGASPLAGVEVLPGARPGDACLRVPEDLWAAFRDVSLWVEALCIHEWSLFTERVSGTEALEAAVPRLASTYAAYGGSRELRRALRDDVAIRFAHVSADPPRVAQAVAGLVESIATARNVARF